MVLTIQGFKVLVTFKCEALVPSSGHLGEMSIQGSVATPTQPTPARTKPQGIRGARAEKHGKGRHRSLR